MAPHLVASKAAPTMAPHLAFSKAAPLSMEATAAPAQLPAMATGWAPHWASQPKAHDLVSPKASAPPYTLPGSLSTSKLPTHTNTSSLQLLDDELGQLVQEASARLALSPDWRAFVEASRGASDLQPSVKDLDHPAAHLLHQLDARGAPAIMQKKPWTLAQKQMALKRGPHKSAFEHTAFLREEFTDMIKKGHWTVLPASQVLGMEQLRLSPLGVVPQRDRRPRTISDYSYFGVNDDTAAVAPLESMQFGRTFYRLLQRIARANPRYGPVHMSKLDIADGFYRVRLLPGDIPKLGVLFPQCAGEEPLIAFPLTLPMGWIHSPPYFCAVTETICDLANQAFQCGAKSPPPHRLELQAQTLPATTTPTPLPGSVPAHGSVPPVVTVEDTPINDPSVAPLPAPRQRSDILQRPVAYNDLYVDDLIALAQGNPDRLLRLQRVLLHTFDQVLRPLEPTDLPARQEPVSVKKLLKGDGAWTTRKQVLGWLVDTVAMTVALPAHRLERLREILASIPPTRRRIATKQWHKFLGELRSMSLAIPGSRGLFSSLQEAFRHPDGHSGRLRLTQAVHDFLEDFRWIAAGLETRPTRIAELIPDDPAIVGTTDASGRGAGAVAFVSMPTNALQPILWRARFPPHIEADLVSFDNPHGTITNSDLELFGTVLHHDVLAHNFDIRERTIHTSHDNTPAVAWQRKGSTTSTGPAAYLLRCQSLHQRTHRYVPLHDYIPGPVNEMADKASRLWHLSDSELLTYFNTHYPQPLPWQLYQPRPEMLSTMITALSKTRSVPESFLQEPPPRTSIGPHGVTSVLNTISTLSSKPWMTQSQLSKSGQPVTAMADSPPAVNPSALQQWRTPSVRWARRSPAWGPTTFDKIPVAKLTTGCSNNLNAGTAKIQPLLASNQFRSPLCNTSWPKPILDQAHLPCKPLPTSSPWVSSS
ncbi:hypothetical protein MPSEU_000961700 [Mayamaea pseudoterrestris]|nr:hypothetical protein MPSEU_000961700 [Mayamaea pseudoterrestris]